jgi:dTDP-4-dehydrorhamnose reductase
LKTVNVLVTGANGQLGSEIKHLTLKQNTDNYTFIDIDEMDLTSTQSFLEFTHGKRYEVIINCAAYTAVDLAEQNASLAYAVNATAAKILADYCLEEKVRLIHISTDYVFDGYGNQPLTEKSPCNPLSVYGKSKWEGEKHVLSSLHDAYVLRTSWVYSSFGKNFVKTIANLAKQKDTLSVVYDQIGSPTYAQDLAAAILQIIENIKAGVKDNPGLYHYSNEGAISWYDLACFIVDYYKLACKVKPIRSEEYPTLATRPRFTVLDKSNVKNSLGMEIPHWHKGLVACLSALKL